MLIHYELTSLSPQNPPAEAEGFDVLYWPQQSTVFMSVRTASLVVTSRDITGLAPFTSYAVVVRFYCAGGSGVGPPSREFDFRTSAARE